MDLTNYLKIKEMLRPNITLVAVSKGQPIDKIMSLYELGHRDFGENFLQELDQKGSNFLMILSGTFWQHTVK